MKKKHWSRYVWRSLAGIVLIGSPLFWPWNTDLSTPGAQPSADYENAAQRIAALQQKAPADLQAVCQTQFFTHGHKTPRAVALVHGYTNCPAQFAELGRRLHALGYNVLIAPLPRHGLSDRMTEAHAHLQAEELVAYANETLDILQGLGEQTGMAGLSAGAVTLSWAVQNRDDLDVAMLIAPAFGLKAIPSAMTAAAMNLTGMLPDSYGWWDPVKQDKGGTQHAYPRFSKHALTQILRLGFAVRDKADDQAPGTKRIALVTNVNDAAVDNDIATETAQDWARHGAAVQYHVFSADQNLNHDLIDPAHPKANIELVYPKLIAMLDSLFAGHQ